MIIVRSPLRITLGGGGTDLPSYYREHGGFLISAAIDKYVYLTLHQTFERGLIIKYSQLERTETVAEVRHPIIREALKLAGITAPWLEITSMADIPAGTGLGSSGSFTTALLKALHVYKKETIEPAELAEEACDIELNKLGEQIGKQDQYIAAFGGLTCFEFERDDRVRVSPLKLNEETLYNLEDNSLLFFTGFTRSASSILAEQDNQTRAADTGMIENLHFIKELGRQNQRALECGDLEEYARLMNLHWERKRQRSRGMTNSEIDDCYQYARAHGALAGKLIGAGGGGFLMFYAHDKVALRHAMRAKGLKELRFRFDFEGTRVLVQ